MAGIGVIQVTDCPVCLGTFKDPRFLPCGHTFCLDCITEHGRSKGSDPDCPNCRTKFQIPSNGFEALPKNYCLNPVLDESTNIVDSIKAKVMKRLCKKHSGEELVLYCVQCKVVICLDCMEDDHKKHDCSKISRFAKEVRLQLEGYIKGIKPILFQVKSQRGEVDDESKKFRNLVDKSELAISEECDNIIQLVNNHRRLLLEELSIEKQRVAKDFKMRSDEIETEQLRLASFNTRIEEMLQGTDEATTFDMVCQYKDFKDSFDKLKQTQPQAMGQVSFTGVEFIPGDFKDVISRGGNIFGRLQKESDSQPKVERSQVLHRDLTPNFKQVNRSLSQRVPIDEHVWYYLERKHSDKLDDIAGQHKCIFLVFYEPSNEGIAHSLEVARYPQDDSDEARKHVDDAVEEFARLYQKVSESGIAHSLEVARYPQDDSDEARKHVDDAVEEFARLYQKVSESGIVKENIKFPLALNQGIPQQLIAEMEEMGVFFLKSDDPCLIGPKACIEEAKQKVVDFICGMNALIQPTDNFGLTQASSADHVVPLTFKTTNGLTVHVSKGDLVRQSLDAIVNPTNEDLSHGDGVALAIAKAAGRAFVRESKKFVRKYRKLRFSDVICTSSGNLSPRIQYVIHTIGPRKSDGKDDEELFELVKFAVYYSLHYANRELNICSIAIPAISSGISGVPIEIVGRASFKALKMFDDDYASSKKKYLREIHFINNDEATFSNMKRIFQSLITTESIIDTEEVFSITEVLDRYADVFGLQRIETTPDDNCLARAFATALQKDFQSKLDWRKVRETIRKEQSNNKDYYKVFHTKKESQEWRSWGDVAENTLDALDLLVNSVSPTNEDEEYDLDVSMNIAANALEAQIVLVLLSEEQEPVERNFKPRLSWNGRSVFIAYHYCGHHHFDALVKKSKLKL